MRDWLQHGCHVKKTSALKLLFLDVLVAKTSREILTDMSKAVPTPSTCLDPKNEKAT